MGKVTQVRCMSGTVASWSLFYRQQLVSIVTPEDGEFVQVTVASTRFGGKIEKTEVMWLCRDYEWKYNETESCGRFLCNVIGLHIDRGKFYPTDDSFRVTWLSFKILEPAV